MGERTRERGLIREGVYDFVGFLLSWAPLILARMKKKRGKDEVIRNFEL